MILNVVKYSFLLLSIFLFSRPVFSQTVFFDPQIFDFNIIHENSGIVFHEFKLINNSSRNYKVKGIINSCGFTNVEISSDSLLTNGFIKVRAAYNPQDRPGTFFKQITFVLAGLGAESVVVDAYLKGNVLSKNEVTFNPLNYQNVVLQIKPLVLNNENTFENANINDFVNDLTLVIDKDGFANIRIEYSKKETGEPNFDAKSKFLKQKIIESLRMRGYQSFPVGFVDEQFRNWQDTMRPFFAVLKVANYNNDKIASSNIIFNGLKSLTKQEIFSDSVSIRYSLNISNPQEKVDWKITKPSEFVTQIVRMVLMTGSATLGIYVNGLFASAEQNFIKKILDPQIKNLFTELSNQGIDFDKINVLPPVFLKGESYNMTYNILEFSQQSNLVSWNKFQFYLDSIRKINDDKINYEKTYKNNIPVYYQRVENQNEFDTANVHFKEWFNLFKNASLTNKKIQIIVEATASNAPTAKAYDNSFVARKRATTAINNLKSYFSKNGLINNQNLFKEPYSLLKGPVFEEQDFSQDYKMYQYIKLIAIETDTALKINVKPTPYLVNFSDNNYAIPTSSLVFQSFIDNLIPTIKKYGFIEVILEASSSKVPDSNYTNKRVLAFECLQNAKDAIIKSVVEKGYNPLRIIFIEENILIQGPSYKQGVNIDKEIFKTYQYIKILPKLFINR